MRPVMPLPEPQERKPAPIVACTDAFAYMSGHTAMPMDCPGRGLTQTSSSVNGRVEPCQISRGDGSLEPASPTRLTSLIVAVPDLFALKIPWYSDEPVKRLMRRSLPSFHWT